MKRLEAQLDNINSSSNAAAFGGGFDKMLPEEDELRRREHEHVATELEISVEALDRHSYRMDDGYSFNGAYMTWRVLWQNQPPGGVTTEGSPGALWTDIMAMTAVRED